MAWESLGGPAEYGIASAAWGEGGEVQIFVLRQDGEVWNRYWDGGAWHPWESLGGSFAARPAAAARDAGRIDLFAIGADGTVRHRWWDGTQWVPWKDVDGAPQGAVAVECSWSAGRLDLFVLGPGGEVWYSPLPP